MPFEPYLEAISEVNEETDLFLSAHSGLPPEELVRDMIEAGVDEVDFDFVLDNETIRERISPKLSGEDYRKTLKFMTREVPHVAPHVNIGLSGRQLEAEREAVDFLSAFDISVLVLLVLIPPRGWEAETPTPDELSSFIAQTRLDFPETPLALGCMRPKGTERAEIETAAIEAGVDRIVLPSNEAEKRAKDLGLSIEDVGTCCSVPEKFLGRWIDG